MKEIKQTPVPEFSSDKAQDLFYNQPAVGRCNGKNGYETLESVNSVLDFFNLEIVSIGNDPDYFFMIKHIW